MISKCIDSEKQLTIHICSGTILPEELLDAIKVLYDLDPTPNHLWDITDADLSQIEGFELADLAKFVKEYVPARIGGRTAFVSATDLGFGLARMYEVFAENAGLRVEVSVFRSRRQAEIWISAAPGE